MARGQAEMLEWIPRLLMMMVAVLVIALLVRYYSHREIDEAPLARSAYIYRLYYDDLLMYADPVTKRVYPGVVDLEKFDGRILERTFQGRISSEIVLTGCHARTIHHNQTMYLQYLPLAQAGIAGPGSATMEAAVFPVTIRHRQAACPGMLNITVVRPNT